MNKAQRERRRQRKLTESEAVRAEASQSANTGGAGKETALPESDGKKSLIDTPIAEAGVRALSGLPSIVDTQMELRAIRENWNNDKLFPLAIPVEEVIENVENSGRSPSSEERAVIVANACLDSHRSDVQLSAVNVIVRMSSLNQRERRMAQSAKNGSGTTVNIQNNLGVVVPTIQDVIRAAISSGDVTKVLEAQGL